MERMSGDGAGVMEFSDDPAILRFSDGSQEMKRHIAVPYGACAPHQLFELSPQQARFRIRQPRLQDFHYLPESSHRHAQIVHCFDAGEFHNTRCLDVQGAQESAPLFGGEPGDGFIGH